MVLVRKIDIKGEEYQGVECAFDKLFIYLPDLEQMSTREQGGGSSLRDIIFLCKLMSVLQAYWRENEMIY